MAGALGGGKLLDQDTSPIVLSAAAVATSPWLVLRESEEAGIEVHLEDHHMRVRGSWGAVGGGVWGPSATTDVCYEP